MLRFRLENRNFITFIYLLKKKKNEKIVLGGTAVTGNITRTRIIFKLVSVHRNAIRLNEFEY